MTRITALIHTYNDAERIARALESLRACDELLVIDHGSRDDTARVAGQCGATVKAAVPGVSPGVYAIDAHHDWVLCLLPSEAVSEALESSLLEWKGRNHHKLEPAELGHGEREHHSVSFQVREQTENGWKELGAHTRLVNRNLINWPDHLPLDDPHAELLPGHLLRYSKA
jgi:hypothetical protein